MTQVICPVTATGKTKGQLKSFVYHDWWATNGGSISTESQNSFVGAYANPAWSWNSCTSSYELGNPTSTGVFTSNRGMNRQQKEPVLESHSWLRNWNHDYLQDVDALFPSIKAGWSVFLTDVQGIHLKTGSLLSRYALPLHFKQCPFPNDSNSVRKTNL